MMSAHDDKIAAAELSRQTAIRKLDALKSQFMVLVVPMIQQLFETGVKHEVTRAPARTKAMGPDGLKSLKDQLRQWQERAPSIAESYLNSDSIWVHQSQYFEESRLRFETKSVQEAICGAVGQIGQLLKQFGYLETHRPEDWSGFGGKLKYPGKVSFEQIHEDIFQSYASALLDLHVANLNLTTARRLNEESEAGDLWDKA